MPIIELIPHQKHKQNQLDAAQYLKGRERALGKQRVRPERSNLRKKTDLPDRFANRQPQVVEIEDNHRR